MVSLSSRLLFKSSRRSVRHCTCLHVLARVLPEDY